MSETLAASNMIDTALARPGQRRVIIVSPHFPPSTLAGVHRARHLSGHLANHGWSPTILRVNPACYTETNDPDLARLLPTDIRQIAVGALPAWWMRRLGIGDIGLRAYVPLRTALLQAVRAGEADAVLITGSPFYPLCLSGSVKAVAPRVPVVLDFQDPWVSSRRGAHRAWTKAGLSSALARTLEPIALRHADAVTSVSAVQNQEMSERYPWLHVPMEAIPIGGDPRDFDALRSLERTTPALALPPDLVHLSYVGTFLPRAGKLVEALFRAFRLLHDADPGLARSIRMNFIGTSNQPDDPGNERVMPIARAQGVEAFVSEVPRRLPFLDALSVLSRSTGLLLIGSDEPHYTASKIYPALMSGTPHLSIFHRASSADEILRRAGGGENFSFGDDAELDAIVPGLADGLSRLARGAVVGRCDPQAYADVTAHAVAGRFARLFDRLVEARA
jgi:glycosyltransferase involved in cell wall biosynthesis